MINACMYEDNPKSYETKTIQGSVRRLTKILAWNMTK